MVVSAQAHVPGHTAHRGYRLELVDDIPRDEVNVIVPQPDPDEAVSLDSQLVQFRVVGPIVATLSQGRSSQIERMDDGVRGQLGAVVNRFDEDQFGGVIRGRM